MLSPIAFFTKNTLEKREGQLNDETAMAVI